MNDTKPELPKAERNMWPDGWGDLYTADQMAAYGDEREAYGRAAAPAVDDAKMIAAKHIKGITDAADYMMRKPGDEYAARHYRERLTAYYAERAIGFAHKAGE